MQPLVSILIPAFNAELWIADTIQSALAQTWKTREIIVVDDGSSDRTLAIAKKFAADGVTVVTQDNQGAAAARNKAFSLSQGDYLQWLDADDLLASDKIANQVKALGDCPSKRTLLSSAWGHFIYRPERAKFSPTSLWCDLSPVEWLLRYFEQNHWMQTATWLVSRELTEAAGPWDARLLGDDDGEYFTRVILASDCIRFIPEARVFYRRGVSTLGYVGQSNRKLEAHFLSMHLRILHVKSFEDNARVRAACLNYLQRYLVYFYPERPDIVQRMEQLAADLGGSLDTPRLSWKYAWIQRVFGWQNAKRTQLIYNECKSSVLSFWDAALFRSKINARSE
jgi:glycosyltransferase involved in cell wall biosynthesis